MNTCEICAIAELKPDTGLVHAGCKSCEARGLARSPAFYEAAKAEAMTASYRAALLAVFGDKWEDGHRLVKEWGDRLEAGR